MRSFAIFAAYSAVAPAACLIPPTCAPRAAPTAAPAGPPRIPPMPAPSAPSGPPNTPPAAIAPAVCAAPLNRCPRVGLRFSRLASCLSSFAASAVARLNSCDPISKLLASSLKALLKPLILFFVCVD